MQISEAMGPAESAAGLFVRFSKVPKEDKEESAQAGRPIFKEVDYITIMVPGDKTSEVVRPVRPTDKERFRGAWERYNAGHAQVVDGTPLKDWPGVTRDKVEELAYFRVYTVEQLADVSDTNLRNMGPFLALRQRARDFLERAKGAAPLEKMRQELEARDEQLARLQEQVAALMQGRQEGEGTEKRGPGRPRKQRPAPEAEPMPEQVSEHVTAEPEAMG